METYAGYTDEALVGLLREGDELAYTEVYNRYSSLMYSFAVRRLGEREEARDLIADLFLSIWANRAEFVVNTSLSSYLYTAARNRVYNVISHKKIQGRYLDSFQDFLDVGEDDTDFLVRNKELSSLIEREVLLLPEKMREVFLLSRETLLSRKEIALRLGVSEETVKSRMRHALMQLKGKLGSAFFMVFF